MKERRERKLNEGAYVTLRDKHIEERERKHAKRM